MFAWKSPAVAMELSVHEILAEMSLKEKVAIANLDEEDRPYLQYAFDVCVGMDDESSKDVMYRMWKVLQETHTVRVVK